MKTIIALWLLAGVVIGFAATTKADDGGYRWTWGDRNWMISNANGISVTTPALNMLWIWQRAPFYFGGNITVFGRGFGYNIRDGFRWLDYRLPYLEN
jgi:hypothetical protein